MYTINAWCSHCECDYDIEVDVKFNSRSALKMYLEPISHPICGHDDGQFFNRNDLDKVTEM